LLGREVFDRLLEEKVLVARWRKHYSTVRPHSSLGHRALAPEAILPRQLSLESGPMYAVGVRL
jgi:transposase InsO family protein